jgi:hypothetical protein
MPLDADVAAVADLCRRRLELGPDARLGREYFYASLPLCVIDAVFSINTRYAAVENDVGRVCERLGLARFAAVSGVHPARSAQLSISEFLGRVETSTIDELASQLFGNRQRTSTRNGILKADAVLRFARVLQAGRVEHLQDTVGLGERADVEAGVRRIAGQSSGLSWRYFLMLSGDDTRVKPDRMIRRFLARALGREPALDDAQVLLERVVAALRPECPALTPRLLDHLIWRAERAE